MEDRILEVLEITLPIFAIIGLGKILHVRKWLSDEICQGVNRLIANLSLPALIFLSIAQTTFQELVKWPVIVGGLVPIFIGLFIYFPLSFILKIKGESRSPFIYAPFWGNVSYMGIPLAIFAFGRVGGVNAAIINAFTMPFYVIIGTFIIGMHHHKKSDSIFQRIKGAVLNPIPISAIVGILVSLIINECNLKTSVANYPAIESIINVAVSSLELIGKMGLPLALLVIGAALKINTSFKRMLVLIVGCIGRLILAPAATLFVVKYCFPDVAYIDLASCVLVMATPVAVASYVISTKSEVAEDLAGELVVFSTVFSIFTIPLWTYIILTLKA